jgi:hypothetical protein
MASPPYESQASEIVQKIGKTGDLGPEGRVFEIAPLKAGRTWHKDDSRTVQ